LDELGIKSANFRLVDGKLLIENAVYDEMGKPACCYEITYTSEKQNPDNIKEIRLVV